MKKIHVLLLLFALIAVIVLPYLVYSKFLIVLSESMVPIMQMGDVVVVKSEKPENIAVGDIIAFNDPDGRKNVIITHRVVGVEYIDGKLSFKTKGDAVEDADPFAVKAGDLVGRVAFIFPIIGFFLKSGKNPFVFLLLVLIPAALLVADEIRKVMSHGNPLLRRKSKKRKIEIVNYNLGRMLAILLIALAVSGAISMPCLFESGYTPKAEVENGLFPSAVILKLKDDPIPRYAIQSSGNLKIPSNAAVISKAPYILPVFWLDLLARIDPYLPALFTFIFPPMFLTFLLFPVWRRPVYKKRTKRKRGLLPQWI